MKVGYAVKWSASTWTLDRASWRLSWAWWIAVKRSLALACHGADVIQLAVPILAMEKLLALLAGMDLGQAILTDVGSAKGNVVRAAQLAFAGCPRASYRVTRLLVPSRAGSEASNAQLFRRHKVILDAVGANRSRCVGGGGSSLA